jgi:hypothetical protein
MRVISYAREMTDDSAQHLAVMQARNKAFRWPKGKTGRTDMARFYHQAREIARKASPQAMQDLVDLSHDAEDERVRSVWLVAVLDRAGVKPIDFDPNEDKASGPKFDPRNYTPQELDIIETALRLMLRPAGGPAAGSVGEIRGGIADVAPEWE